MIDAGINLINPADRIIRAGGSVVVGAAGQVTITPKAGQNTQIAAGSLGIGLSPSYTLDVSGQVRISGQMAVGGGIPVSSRILDVNGTISASSGQGHGLMVEPTAAATANNDQLFGVRVLLTPSVGSFTGTIAYGLFIDQITAAATNYAVYTNGSTPSSFGGTITIRAAQGGLFAQDANAATGTTYTFLDLTAGNGNAHGQIILDGNNVGNSMGLGGPAMVIRTVTNHPISFWTNNTERVRIDPSGNVGVGAASAGGRLEVYGAAGGPASELVRHYDTTAMAAGVGASVGFYGKYTTGGAYANFGAIRCYKANGTTGDYSGGLIFYYQPGTTAAEGFRLDSSGNWILGSNLSTTVLNTATVYSNAQLGGLAIYAASSTAGGSAPVVYLRSSHGTVGSPTDVASNDNGGCFVAQWYSGGTVFNTAQITFTVDGTFTTGQRPPSRIDFITNAANGAQIKQLSLDASGNLIQAGGYYAQGSSVATAGSIRFGATPSIYCTHGASNIRMISDDGTFVWIGLNGFADTKIDSAAFYLPNITTTASAANAFIDNSNSNKVLRSTSSLRYKDVLGDLSLDEAYRLVLGLKPIAYTSRSKSDDPDRVHVGFGAEDVAALDERFVVLDAKGRPDGVQYGVLTAPLAAVVQDLARRLRELETAGAR